jgi:hypothetical protein
MGAKGMTLFLLLEGKGYAFLEISTGVDTMLQPLIRGVLAGVVLSRFYDLLNRSRSSIQGRCPRAAGWNRPPHINSGDTGNDVVFRLRISRRSGRQLVRRDLE